MSPSHVENDVTLKPSIIPQRGGVSEAGDPTSAQGGRKNPRTWHVEGDVTLKPSIIFRPGFHQPKCQPQPATASRCEESTCHKSPCAACFSNDSRQECEKNANKLQMRAASGAGQLTHNKPNQRPTPWLKTNHLGAAYRLPGPRHRWNPIWARTTQPVGVQRTKHYPNLCRPSSAKLSPQCSLPLPPTLRPSICVWSSGRLPSNLACETAQPTGASPVEDSLSGPNWTRKHNVARGPLCRNTPRQRVQALLALPSTPAAAGPPVKRPAPQLNRLGNPGAFGHGRNDSGVRQVL
jgi:hypothetical protein